MIKFTLKVVGFIRDVLSLGIIAFAALVMFYSLVLAVGWLDHLDIQTTQESLSDIFSFLMSVLILLNTNRFIRLMGAVSDRITEFPRSDLNR
jgi:hypothetical protein